MDNGDTRATPKCVGSTGDIYRCSVRENLRQEAGSANGDREQEQDSFDSYDGHEESNYFKSAQW